MEGEELEKERKIQHKKLLREYEASKYQAEEEEGVDLDWKEKV